MQFNSSDTQTLLLEGSIQGQFLLENATFDSSGEVEVLQQFCQVPAQITTSAFNVKGEASIGGDITRKPDETETIQFTGTVNVLVEGECPPQIQTGSRIQLVTQEDGLTVTPVDIGLELGQLADVVMSDIMVFFESGIFTDIEQFGVLTDINVTEGEASVKGRGFISSVDIQQSIAGATTTANLVGGFSENGGVTTLSIDDLKSDITIEESLPGTAITITATVNLDGSFQAELDFSQAVQVNLDPSKAIPSQSQLNEEKQQETQEERESKIAPSPVAFGSQILQQTKPTLPDGTCPARYEFTDLPGTCSCAPGWAGLDCSQCKSNQACVDWLLVEPSDEDIEATECSHSYLLQNHRLYFCERHSQCGMLENKLLVCQRV
eukprot:TRINITY_DN29034_c0_g1_i4.p1 TRINITY_DN29034_c0_g1~~TRINITY_DN29034_c0_g1_i4.p1  ORF type:complete len:379 (-),score=58.17 TRINITY_DN29034_c0_g1_i4:195-1331(-)